MCLLAANVWAMGGGTGSSPTSIPQTKQNFSVNLVDSQGIQVELDTFSIEGELSLPGQRGQGQIAIPLENIDSIRILQNQNGHTAQVSLRQGQQIELIVKPGLRVTGKTAYGNFSIKMGDISFLEIKTATP